MLVPELHMEALWSLSTVNFATDCLRGYFDIPGLGRGGREIAAELSRRAENTHVHTRATPWGPKALIKT